MEVTETIPPDKDPKLFAEKFKSYVNLITEDTLTDDPKFKAAQELSEHLEFIVSNPHYPQFLEYLLNKFLHFIQSGEPIYQENSKAQIRKLVLEIIHRLPRNSDLEPHVRTIQSIMFKLIERENEDCALVCMRTIHELQKIFKPNTANEENEVKTFLEFVKQSFQNIPDTMRRALVNDAPPAQPENRRVIPKATHSLKLLGELPLQVVLFHQNVKKIEDDVGKLITLMINHTLTLHPEPSIMNSPHFVRDGYVDFIMVQIKTISFLAYMIKFKPYQELISCESNNFIKGLIACFRNCPPEAPHLRREVIVACRHIVSYDFKWQMVGYMDQLLDENVLIGTGWTMREGSRSLAYSTLADLIHQVREKLSLKQLAQVVYLFSKNVHDEDLTPSMQNMACKILINIADFINKKSEKEGSHFGREILMRMLEVFVQKFQNIAKHQIPQLFAKCAKQTGTEIPTTGPAEQEKEDKKGNLTVSDCRTIVKTLVCGVKTITWCVNNCKAFGAGQPKFGPKETYLFIRLLKYGLQCLNIYRIQVSPAPERITYIRAPTNNYLRSKEEKDIVEHFAGVFIYSKMTFREVFETQLDYLVESIHKNQSLSIIAYFFLTTKDSSPGFAYLLAKYLVDKLEDMGGTEAEDRPMLYSRLFRLLFGSVQCQGQDETEFILKPHLQKIVNKSMELAQTAKDPVNYFQLLRHLFRAIGSASGQYDEMYNEFLPLLPSLLQSLNRLQSGLHKQQMKDLFIELCLTVPVRLSNLLPYLPALMDPLVSALNGSNTLIAQGLRTLELCIDNLQPNFFYESIEPVRAELIHALWQTLQSPTDNAKSAYRVLGKFGARNRKTLQDAPKLEYSSPDNIPASIVIFFPGSDTPVKLPIQKVLDHALSLLKGAPDTELFYMQHSLAVMQSYIVSMISLSDTTTQIQKLLATISRKQAPASAVTTPPGKHHVCTDEPTRTAFKTALMGLFVATATKQLRNEATNKFMMAIVRHFSLLTVVQQSGVFQSKKKFNNSLDVHVLIDVIAECMGSEEADLASFGQKAIRLVTETCKYILGSAERAFQLPFFDVLVEKLCGLCYERAWYSKAGGVSAIEWLITNAPLLWAIRNQQLFITATLYVMMDLHQEVSYGTMGRAQVLFEKVIRHCNTPNPTSQAVVTAQEKVFHGVVHLLVKEMISPYDVVRKQAREALTILSTITSKSVKDITAPFRDILNETVLPRKLQLFHQQSNNQLAYMEAVTYCTTLEPRLLTLDIAESPEHLRFLEEVFLICDVSKEESLTKYNCYKRSTNFTQLRMSALRVLAACHYIPEYEAKIFKVMYSAMSSTDKELQACAKECIQTYQSVKSIEMDIVHNSIRPLLQKLTDFKNLNQPLIQILTYLMELFPKMFNEKLCDQLLKHLKKWMETSILSIPQHQQGRAPNNFTEEIMLCQAIINTFHLIPATDNLMNPLITLILRAEKILNLEIGSPFQEGLFKFVLNHPVRTVELFLHQLYEPSMNRMFYNFLKHKNGGPLRNHLMEMPTKLLSAAFILPNQGPDIEYSQCTINDVNAKYQELLFQGILITSLLVKHNPNFLVRNPELVNHLKNVWNQQNFQEKFRNPDKLQVQPHQWREPKLLAKCLLNHLQHNTNELELLFQLLNLYDAIYVPNIKFLNDYIQYQVIEGYTIDQRRAIFFKFVEMFQARQNTKYSQDLKGKILQHIIVPMFQYSFEKGDTEQLIEGSGGKESDNIISVFMDKDSKIISTENYNMMSDAVRIHLLKLSAEFVKHAANYIHPTNSNSKKQGDKLRTLMRYAWPCLLPKNSHDPTTKFYGHLLLALIISKFAIHKKIVLQVFHSLLKAHNLEARSVVCQALEIITPALPARMEDGKAMLYHWTKKIIVEDGHTISQLVHLLSLIVRQYRVYYLWRMYLVQHMLTAMQKFAFSQSVTIEHQKLAVDLAEVIIKWEIQRTHETRCIELTDTQIEDMASSKIPLLLDTVEAGTCERTSDVVNLNPCPLRPPPPDPLAPFDQQFGEGVVHFLLRLAYYAYERPTGTNIQHSEALSKRCIQLLKVAMKPDIFNNCNIKISWAERELQKIKTASSSTEGPPYSVQGICTILQLVEFLLDVLKPDNILKNIKNIYRGLAACMSSSQLTVTKAVHSLLGKLFAMFPIEQRSNHEELESLYAHVNDQILGGLENYEKASAGAAPTLYSPLMILKAACATSPRYLERCLHIYIKCLQKLQKEHCNSNKEANAKSRDASIPNVTTADLILVCVDLVKDQVDILTSDTRKVFFSLLLSLIEKSPDPKLLKTITEVVYKWVQNQSATGATLREKTLLLTKMNNNYERHFPNDTELLSTFLNIVLYVYTDESLKNSELGTKLESAFMTGLRFSDPEMRCKFTEVLRKNVPLNLYERLLSLLSHVNWKLIGPHFWIKQFIEMLLSVSDDTRPLSVPNKDLMLPSLMTSAMASPDEAASTTAVETFAGTLDNPGPVVDSTGENSSLNTPTHNSVLLLAEKHGKFLEGLKDHKSGELVASVSQLAHDSTDLAHHLWVNLFPEFWGVLTDEQQTRMGRELPAFLCSSTHREQGEQQPSAIGCFLQSLTNVPIQIRPCFLKYLGSTHNTWHQMVLRLEELGTAGETFASFQLHQKQVLGEYPVIKDESQDALTYEAIDCLTALYSQLNEHDMWTGLWLRRCKYPDTIKALSYQNLGFFEYAQAGYEDVMRGAVHQFKNTCATTSQQTEFKLWKEQWVECTKQCAQWDILTEFGKSKDAPNPALVLESAWRIPDWNLMKEVLGRADHTIPDSMSHMVSLYQGYSALQQDEDPGADGPVERLWKQAINNALRQWRRLPKIVSNAHIPLLQFAQQVAELHEAQQIHLGLVPTKVTSNTSKMDMKATLKAWRNRPPVLSDNIGHWNDIFAWRQYNINKITEVYTALENQPLVPDGSEHQMNQQNPLVGTHQQNALVGTHACASTMVIYASLARKHGLVNSAQEWLARVHTLPSVHIQDCHKKIREQIKCHLVEPVSQSDLLEALDVIEGINMKYITKPEIRADIFAYKAHIFSLLGKGEEAQKTFSCAIQICDQRPGAWALWAKYNDDLFMSDTTQLHHAESALACYLQACSKQSSDTKCRKYIARILWLLAYDGPEESLSKTVEKFAPCVMPVHWLEWIPQLLAGLGNREGRVMHMILHSVGKAHPQALYFPIRALYLSLKAEVQDITTRHKAQKEAGHGNEVPDNPPEMTRIRPRMMGCSKLLQVLRDSNPTLLSALEIIIEQITFMKEMWYDEVLHKLYTAVKLCEVEAFDHRDNVLNVQISTHIYNYIRNNIMSYFSQVTTISNRGQHRDMSTLIMLKQRFEQEFEMNNTQGKKLHTVLRNLKKWIKMLDKSPTYNQKNILLEDHRCNYLSRFCSDTAEVHLIGEYLNPKAHSTHYVKIARFLPKIDTVRKHSMSARRLYIRGSNGKVYPYLIMNVSNVRRARSQERFLQLMRTFNKLLTQKKEACRRTLVWNIPKVVAVSPQFRLIEDNTSKTSILDVYKWYCKGSEMEVDAPITYYYEQLGLMQTGRSVLNRIALNHIYHHIQTNILPPNVILKWAQKTYPDPVSFWTFRQQMTRQTALDCLAQFFLFLTSLAPEYINISQDSGTLSTIHYHFSVNQEDGQFLQDQPIPFRLTPNMMTLMGPIAVSGLMIFSIISAARCLADPKLGAEPILFAILKDEMQSFVREMTDSRMEKLIADVQTGVTSIMTRLQSTANFDKGDSKVPSYISLATNPENLCRLDPAWYPWL